MCRVMCDHSTFARNEAVIIVWGGLASVMADPPRPGVHLFPSGTTPAPGSSYVVCCIETTPSGTVILHMQSVGNPRVVFVVQMIRVLAHLDLGGSSNGRQGPHVD